MAMIIGCKLGVTGVITAMEKSILGGAVVRFSASAILEFVSWFGSDAKVYTEVFKTCL